MAFHMSTVYAASTDLSSALLSSPQSKDKKIKMAFAGILTDADITAALAACQGRPLPGHRDTLCVPQLTYQLGCHVA